jgi:hypothetical protein
MPLTVSLMGAEAEAEEPETEDRVVESHRKEEGLSIWWKQRVRSMQVSRGNFQVQALEQHCWQYFLMIVS